METKKTMLVTGGGGMVGSYVPELFRDYNLILTDITDNDYEHLDVRNADQVSSMIRKTKPAVVLHLAAVTDVDQCEKDPDTAYLINTIGTYYLASACREFGSRIVFASTGAVFFGEKSEPYTEFDNPHPRNIYGNSKLQAEKILLETTSNCLICRAGWMIGGGRKDKKFVGKIADMIKKGKKNIQAVNDKFGSPTYAKDFLIAVRVLLESRNFGLFHVVNEGCVSRYEMALAVRDALGVDDIEITSVNSSFFPLPAPRGNEALKSSKLHLMKIHIMRAWKPALSEYVTEQLQPLPCV